VCAEASNILSAAAADFIFNCWSLEIPSDNRIRHVPRCVHYHAQGFRLKRSRICLEKMLRFAVSNIILVLLHTAYILYLVIIARCNDICRQVCLYHLLAKTLEILRGVHATRWAAFPRPTSISIE
jgi:hypothetical protein